jgi:RES domain-containing protein
MRLWRLSGIQHANALDGGYGLHFDGRWSTVGHAVTYCATSPSLCVLEKLVHVEDPALLPALIMVAYELPDSVSAETVTVEALPADWRHQESFTQQHGDAWHDARTSLLLKVPSAIVPVSGSPDFNVLVNHAHADAVLLTIAAAEPFTFDPRLL